MTRFVKIGFCALVVIWFWLMMYYLGMVHYALFG